ncbi:MAG TPA: ABC transporter permease, partial [Gammaproteobacteria bacterium]|nr:ABC transporter permease [Gammaproteobacteria bacterium]
MLKILKTLQLATRLLWREWWSGSWLILCFALVITITAISAVNFYIDRLEQGFDQQSAAMLGGDLVITSATPIPSAWQQQAQQLQLQFAEVWSYPTMVHANDQLILVNLQAVSAAFPLIQATPTPQTKKLAISAHTVNVEPRLLALLAINIGDEITIGS